MDENRKVPTTGAMDAVRKLILQKADEKETNLAELSRKIGRNHAYLQQFIHREVPANLPETVRAPLAEELGVDEDDLKPLGLKSSRNGTPNKVQPASEKLIAPAVRDVTVSATQHRELGQIPGAELVGERDLPVFGTAQGGKGAVIVTDQAVDWVARPTSLLRVKDGYGIIITGDSMSPQHKSGSTALVNPHLPPRAGDTCIFRSTADDGTVLICIKELVRFTDDTWYVKQYQPKKSFTLKRSQWQECHVTVGNFFSR